MTPQAIKGNILVVDNDPTSLRLVGYLLRRFYPNVKIHVIENGKKALQSMQKTDYDLVIIDYSLGDMNGDELASMIKSTDSKSAIIMITAKKENLDKGKKEDRYDFIDKSNGFVGELTDTVGVYLKLSKIQKKTTTMVERLEQFAYVS